MRFFVSGKFAAACLAAAVFAASAAGQGKPKAAVYVTGGAKVNFVEKAVVVAAGPVVGEALAKAIGLTGKSEGVNLTKDITKEFGPAVGAAQAAEVGRKFGVQSLCIVTLSGINPQAKSFNMSVELVDVSSGRVTAKGGPANVNLGSPPGILTAATTITAGLVVGLAANAAAGGPQTQPAPPQPTAQQVQYTPVQYTPSTLSQQAVQPAQPAPVQQAQPALPMNERPYIAVYAGRGHAKDDEVKNAFAAEMLFALARSGRYRPIESNSGFVANVNREAEKTGITTLTDRQIAYIGGMSGAAYICIIDVSTVLGSYQVFARVIDAKTLDAVEMGKATGKVYLAEDVTTVANKVVESMFGAGFSVFSEGKYVDQQIQVIQAASRVVQRLKYVEQQVQRIESQLSQVQYQIQQSERQIEATRKQIQTVQSQVYAAHPKFARREVVDDGPDDKPRYLKKGISVEGGVAVPISSGASQYDYDDYYYGYGYYDYRDRYDYYDGVGFGAHFKLDLIYAELFGTINTLVYGDAGLLVKIPVGNDYFKWYPIVGLCVYSDGGGGFTFGSRVAAARKTMYATSEYLYSAVSGYTAYMYRGAVGWDIGLGERKQGFFRPEYRYSYIWTQNGDHTSARHLSEFRAVFGYKGAGNRKSAGYEPYY